MNKKTEWFPLIDEKGNMTGKATRQECHSGSKQLHPVVHLQLFNSKGELFLQKRAMTKDIQPGKWDTAVGGHVDYGETIAQALNREAREELGIDAFKPEFSFHYIYESEIEREMVYSFRTVCEQEITPDPEELDGGKFWTMEEIRQNLEHDIFTPNFEYEFDLLLKAGIVR